MSKNNVLVLSSGGARQAALCYGMLQNEAFRKYVCSCDHICGTSAGALVGLILALAKDTDQLKRFSSEKHCMLPHIGLARMILHMLLNEDSLPLATLKKKVEEGIQSVTNLRNLTNLTELRFARALTVGTQDRGIYREETFKKNYSYPITYVEKWVLGSGAIEGLTASPVHDGAAMHPFPVRKVRQLLTSREATDFVYVCPYPDRYLFAPRTPSRNVAHRFKNFVLSIFSDSVIGHMNEDNSLFTNHARQQEVDSSAQLKFGISMISPSQIHRFFVVQPTNYYAPKEIVGLTPDENKELTSQGNCMAKLFEKHYEGGFKPRHDKLQW